jgi:hypothetical protein
LTLKVEQYNSPTLKKERGGGWRERQQEREREREREREYKKL